MDRNIQAVLAAHRRWLDGEEDGVRAVLTGADLSRANLRGAVLTDADLRGADLTDAVLRGADLEGADLRRAVLRRADCRRANLAGANLTDANFAGADLEGANLTDADLRFAYFGGARLTDAALTGARLNWRSHDLMAALLRQAAGQDAQRRALAALVVVSTDWCWDEFSQVAVEMSLASWAKGVLHEYVNTDTPEEIRHLLR